MKQKQRTKSVIIIFAFYYERNFKKNVYYTREECIAVGNEWQQNGITEN